VGEAELSSAASSIMATMMASSRQEIHHMHYHWRNDMMGGLATTSTISEDLPHHHAGQKPSGLIES
jgi:hypothetical protein